jgi:hypothetical protein
MYQWAITVKHNNVEHFFITHGSTLDEAIKKCHAYLSIAWNQSQGNAGQCMDGKITLIGFDPIKAITI